jgi:hypothetical protein
MKKTIEDAAVAVEPTRTLQQIATEANAVLEKARARVAHWNERFAEVERDIAELQAKRQTAVRDLASDGDADRTHATIDVFDATIRQRQRDREAIEDALSNARTVEQRGFEVAKAATLAAQAEARRTQIAEITELADQRVIKFWELFEAAAIELGMFASDCDQLTALGSSPNELIAKLNIPAGPIHALVNSGLYRTPTGWGNWTFPIRPLIRVQR